VRWYTTFGAVEITEQLLRLGRRGAEWRPFCAAAGVCHRGYSARLQRAMVDFGSEDSFARAVARLWEHYEVAVPVESLRQQTLRHGRSIATLPGAQAVKPASTLITQMDGSMIPVMQPGCGEDARKGKQLFWREVRLCVARPKGSVAGVYGATLGSAQTAAWLWQEVASGAGLTASSYVHGLGDGADWIVDKFTENFGNQGRYLLDFYHVSEYLAAAAKTTVAEKQRQTWRRRQQGRLLNGQTAQVFRALRGQLEPPEISEAPVRSAYNYLRQRREQLGYQEAREQELPIGSGEIESGHRHVIQQRLKRSGCWWKQANAQAMLNLRVARANNLWNQHWTASN